MNKQKNIDYFAQNLSPDIVHSVMDGASSGTEKRFNILNKDFENADELRVLAGKIKSHTINNLDTYLDQAVKSMNKNGVQTHFAINAQTARQIILELLKNNNIDRLVKSKSMATEEIHLNEYLEENGIDCLETDLGEFIVQLDKDKPSHIVKPIIHKNRNDVASTFERFGLGSYNNDPETITRRARAFMRKKFLESDVCITGGNFISAESGKLVLVTNEGNARFGISASKIHIALVGVEKLVPRDKDLGLYLNLLARSATGQHITVYTHFLTGPRKGNTLKGPEEMHVIFLDNGRIDLINTEYQDVLNCIRCGACQNVCPVYRQSSGHAYRGVYAGPIGAVINPIMFKTEIDDYSDLPFASTLCGACNEVCPVNIPLQDLLVRLRGNPNLTNKSLSKSMAMRLFAFIATSPKIWRLLIRSSKLINLFPPLLNIFPPLRIWKQYRHLPNLHGLDFRQWYNNRNKNLKD